ncbi:MULTISPECIES: hypothetical protein [Streptomyces]|uniref:hypothetical protein n=1 Tax=Streptomyces TaxID=1883 RepID=UPI002E374E21|nr:hypothetical protein [Streptomyces pseudovenezuelae]
MRTAGVVAAVALGAALLTGCGDDRPCLESHIEIQPVTTFNGKTTSVHLVPVSVCDKREGEK